MDLGEWLQGYRGVADYGFVAFSGITDDASAEAVFNKIDENGGGFVLLIEFCDYIKAAEIAAQTPMGATLDEDEGKDSGNADEYRIDFSKARSQPLTMFTECFAPLCAKNDEGAKQRKAGFRSADPNGNGLCSLAELETYVLKNLLYRFKKEVAKSGGFMKATGASASRASAAGPPPTPGRSFPKTGPPKITNKQEMSGARAEEHKAMMKATREKEKETAAAHKAFLEKDKEEQRAKAAEQRAKLLEKAEELSKLRESKAAARGPKKPASSLPTRGANPKDLRALNKQMSKTSAASSAAPPRGRASSASRPGTAAARGSSSSSSSRTSSAAGARSPAVATSSGPGSRPGSRAGSRASSATRQRAASEDRGGLSPFPRASDGAPTPRPNPSVPKVRPPPAPAPSVPKKSGFGRFMKSTGSSSSRTAATSGK